MMSPQGEGFVTIAYGHSKYVTMAKALSLSYRRHNPSRPIAIVTDEENAHTMGTYFDTIVKVNPEYGTGVVQKLYLDLYSPFERTLFVDSDCLFYRHPDVLWELYAHNAFSIRGWRYLTGRTAYERRTPYRWVEDTSQFLRLNDISRLAHFNAGVFFFDHSDKATALFEIARSLYEKHAELGFIPFKGAPLGDEPAFAVAMEKCGITMDPWDSTRGMETAIGMKKALAVNVLKGKSRFFKDKTERHPVLIHFNVHAQDGLIYNRDISRLLYEGSRFRSLRVAVAIVDTCVPAFCRNLLRRALKFGGRGREPQIPRLRSG